MQTRAPRYRVHRETPGVPSADFSQKNKSTAHPTRKALKCPLSQSSIAVLELNSPTTQRSKWSLVLESKIERRLSDDQRESPVVGPANELICTGFEPLLHIDIPMFRELRDSDAMYLPSEGRKLLC